MRLLGILFSCVCLQMASVPGPKPIGSERVVQLDPDCHASRAFISVEEECAEIIPLSRLAARARGEGLITSAPAILLGPKDFLIRSGLSPPLVQG